jgi:hypothetical protein
MASTGLNQGLDNIVVLFEHNMKNTLFHSQPRNESSAEPSSPDAGNETRNKDVVLLNAKNWQVSVKPTCYHCTFIYKVIEFSMKLNRGALCICLNV